jgi:hypothetical protein
MTTPHPGSRTHASALAELAAEPDQAQVAAKNSELQQQEQEQELASVPVMLTVPEGAVFSTMLVAISSARQLMPQDAQRERALILSIDEDVILCQTKEQAQNAANQASSATAAPSGFYLSKGILLELKNKSLTWVANTSGSSATRVSVVVERNENPDTLGDS